MNDQLQAALADILSKATTALHDGADFLRAELPEVVQQFLLWKVVSAAVFAVIFFSAAAVLARVIYKAVSANETGIWREKFSQYHEYTEWTALAIFTSIFGSVGFLVTSAIAVSAAMESAKILIAPKVYLLEYIASLAK